LALKPVTDKARAIAIDTDGVSNLPLLNAGHVSDEAHRCELQLHEAASFECFRDQ
jgi:hypothetical protein